MTGPTASTPSPHDLPPSFAYHSSYDDVITYIAESDDVSGLETNKASSSSCTAVPKLDWPHFKLALKWKIKQILDSFPENPEPLLHAAAAARAPRNGRDSGSEGDVGMGKTSFGLSEYSAAANSGGSTNTPEGAANALASRFSSSSSSAPRNPQLLTGSDDSSSDESDGLDNPILAYGVGPAGEDGEEESAKSGVTSTFMAAKTRPPPERYGSWGRRLSREETEREKLMIFGMLDEFETSPPFTIQRLCELLLRPNSYVRSAPKLLASLSRILAMTASHADFPPVSPGPPPNVVSTNGSSGAMDRTSGMIGPPSPINEPIFSPIPFLRRLSRNNGLPDEEGSVHKEESVPPLSLARDGVDGDEEMHERESLDYRQLDSLVPKGDLVSSITDTVPDAASGSVLSNPTPSLPQATSRPSSALAPVGSDSTPTTNSAGGTGLAHVPLGVPSGRVDELDQVASTHDAPLSRSEGQTASSISAIGNDVPVASKDLEARAKAEAGRLEEGSETTSGRLYHHMDASGTVHPLSSTTTLPAAEAEEEGMRPVKRLKSEEVEDGSV